MKFVYSQHCLNSLRTAPSTVRAAFAKQLGFLETNLRHPSLRARKYDESSGLWQARVNRDWRFYFTIESDEYHLHEIRSHPK